MAMRRSLDLTLISGKDLKDVNLLTKMDLYATVSLSIDPKTKLKTPVDHDCGKNPSWNHHVQLHVPAGEGVDLSTVFLQVVILSEKNIGADREVGRVDVSVKELEADANASGSESKTVTYQVRTPSGSPKGYLTFSYKFGDPVPFSAAPDTGYAPPAGYPPSESRYGGEPVPAYPMAATAPVAYPPSAGPSTAYPPAAAYPPPSQAGYGYAAPPPQAGYGYPPPQGGYGGYGPPPAQQGYGYPPPPAGYPGYAPQGMQQQQPKKKKNNFGLGLGAGLLGGAIGGMLIGDAIGDAADYDAGYDAGFDDGGGFDF